LHAWKRSRSLSGGPGQAAIPLTGDVGAVLRSLRDDHDLVFVDQRGPGASGAVDCGGQSLDAVSACGERLGARRAFMSTRETALDVEDLRVALGVERLTPLGVSYGAMVAEAYARLFPQRVAALVLDSPASVDGFDVMLELPQLALRRVLGELCGGGACRRTLPNAAKALGTLAGRLRRGPLRGLVVDRGASLRGTFGGRTVPIGG
jgi:pimeloyl-ACP methyl ester carboxylesterase